MSIDINKYVNSYEFDYTLPGSNEVIIYKPITTGQLKKLLPYENETDTKIVEKLLDDLISNCVLSEGFNIDNLYLEDRFALLIELRRKSKGEEYSFIYTCPKCESRTPITKDLNTLKCTKKSFENDTFVINENLSCKLDQITRGEQKKIYEMIEKEGITNNNLKIAQIATYSYAMSMRTFITPEGETNDVSIEDKINIIDGTFNDKQYENFVKWFSDNAFGIDFSFDFQCSNTECNNKEQYSIPLTNFFA
jgi:hypothetical protein